MRNRYRYRNRQKQRILVLDKEDREFGCWVMENEYPILDGKYIYREYAAGEGIVSRHLCSIKNCINPRHLVRGSYSSNSVDEWNKKFSLNKILVLKMDKEYYKSEANKLHVYVEDLENYIGINYELFAKWKRITTGEYWDIDLVKAYAESVWKRVIMGMIRNNSYYEKFSEDIICEQGHLARKLMLLLQSRPNIVIVEV